MTKVPLPPRACRSRAAAPDQRDDFPRARYGGRHHRARVKAGLTAELHLPQYPDKTFNRSLGLASVTAEGRLFMWGGQSTGADLTRANFKQIRNELIELGLITESEFDRSVDLLAQYKLLFPSPIMWAVRGRRQSYGHVDKG